MVFNGKYKAVVSNMNSNYNKPDSTIINELKKIVGSRYVLSDECDIQGYSSDETPFQKPYYPEVVIKPGDTNTISRVLKLANNNKIPVVPRGSGTGLSGGAIPVYGGIVLSLERMNRILEIDENNMTAEVECGVKLTDLCTEVEKRGLYYPLHPGEISATLGGNVATNAGGMNAVKYGVTRQHVIGIEAVLASGKIIKCGGKFVKVATGYDLTQLLIGSEGTLGVITKIILKLSAKLPAREILYAPFNDLQSAIDAVPEILKLKKYPTGLEFIEKDIIDIVEKYTGKKIPYHEYAAFLMIIMEGETQEEVLAYFASVEEILLKHGAVAALVPNSEGAKRRLFDFREKFYPAIKNYAPMELIDIVVPRSMIARFVDRVKEISGKYGIPVIAYGHAGDGNVHLHPIMKGISESEWHTKLPLLLKEIYLVGVSLGGAISGEHGIGLVKKDYLPLQFDRSQIDLLRRVKKAFDPNRILNPGKIFD